MSDVTATLTQTIITATVTNPQLTATVSNSPITATLSESDITATLSSSPVAATLTAGGTITASLSSSPITATITGITEADPIFVGSQAYNITAQNITDLGNLSGTNTGDQSASDFNHDDLANITGTASQYNHPTDAQMTVLGNTSGTNTGDQVASDVGITDSGDYYTGSEVETALQEIGLSLSTLSSAAEDVTITDAGGYYTGANVEAALQEIGAGTTLDGRYLKLDCSNDPLTRGLYIDGGADEVHLQIDMDASQTANALAIRKSDGTVTAGADSRGILFSNGGTPATNFFFGGGNSTASGTYNVGIGLSVLNLLTTGNKLTIVGGSSGSAVTTAAEIVSVGYLSLSSEVASWYQVAIGSQALTSHNSTKFKGYNTAVGQSVLANSIDGARNSSYGALSGLSNANGSGNNYFGYFAGAYHTGSNTLIIDNQNRGNSATEQTNAILYGTMAATPASQSLRINAVTTQYLSDATTNTITRGAIVAKATSGTPAAGFGSGVLFNLESSTTADQNAASIDAYWSTATHASRTAALDIKLVTNTAALASVLDLAHGGSTLSSNLTIGSGTAGTDYTLTFDGETNDGVIAWKEDEDYFEFQDDVVFNGGGLAYGGIYLYNNSTSDSIASGSYVQMTRFDSNGVSNNTTPDHTNDHITIDVAGTYLVSLSASFSGTGGVTWNGGVFKNNGATQLTNIQIRRKLGASGDVGAVATSGHATFAANDTVEVWFRQDEGVNKNLTVVDCNLHLVQIG